jgi:hypothetical protein
MAKDIYFLAVKEASELQEWLVVKEQKPENVTVVIVCSSDDTDLQDKCETFASAQGIQAVNL